MATPLPTTHADFKPHHIAQAMERNNSRRGASSPCRPVGWQRLSTAFGLMLAMLLLGSGPAAANTGPVSKTVTGTVTEHHLDCVRDGVCYFVLKAQQETWTVAYQPAEGLENCLPPDFSAVVRRVKVGSVIKASGRYSLEGRLHTITFCDRSAELQLIK